MLVKIVEIELIYNKYWCALRKLHNMKKEA